MAGTKKRIAGPAFLSNAAANIYTPAASTIQTILLHIHVFNVTAAAASFSLYVGATGGSAAGTELFKTRSIAANSEFDYYCELPMASTDFLSGLASASSTLVIVVEGEMNVV